jgi:hypothetical protein
MPPAHPVFIAGSLVAAFPGPQTEMREAIPPQVSRPVRRLHAAVAQRTPTVPNTPSPDRFAPGPGAH